MSLQISLEVQGLRIHFSMQQTWIQSLLRELRSHMPHGQKKKKEILTVTLKVTIPASSMILIRLIFFLKGRSQLFFSLF